MLFAFFWVITRRPNFICRCFETLCSIFIPNPPVKMEQTECSEKLAYKIQMSGNYPEESIQDIDSLVFLHICYPNRNIKTYGTMVLPVGVYGSGTWSLILTEEHRLRIFDNSVLRRIFGPNREEVTVEMRRLHNEGHYNLYSSPKIIRVITSRRMRWAGHVARTWEMAGA